MYTGSCYCSQVKYRINGPIDYVVHCHCKPCRKVAGAAYYSAGFIAHSSFEITSGEGLVKTQKNIWNRTRPQREKILLRRVWRQARRSYISRSTT